MSDDEWCTAGKKRSKNQEKAENGKPAKAQLNLVVISGLPGLGKSYFLNKMMGFSSSAGFSDRVCFVQKDEISMQFKAAHAGSKAGQNEILNIALETLEAFVGPTPKTYTFVFNMNMNAHWMQALVSRINEKYALRQFIFLLPPMGPPPMPSFRRLHAAAVVLACDVRTGSEPESEASTLQPEKAWEVLSSSHFSKPSAISSPEELLGVLSTRRDRRCPHVIVRYPVPLLKDSVHVPDELPSTKPAEWVPANLVFPSAEATEDAIRALFAKIEQR
jgi:hypothetical protein